jgi:hypothetical protein
MLSLARIIALNRGGNVFEPGPIEPMDVAGPLIAANDVTGDGHADLIYEAYGRFSVAPGRGDGTFGPLIVSSSPDTLDTVRFLDFNHDGALDFVGVDHRSSSGFFQFLQSSKDGRFHVVGTAPYDAFDDSAKMGAGDFDGDGNVDFFVVKPIPFNGTSVLDLGWNDGAFHFTKKGLVIDGQARLNALDIDGDGVDEMVGISSGVLVIVRAKHREVTIEEVRVGPPETPDDFQDAMSVDFDGDGNRDIVFKSYSTLGVVWGTRDGHFQDLTFYEFPGAHSFTALDIDGDGVIDVAGTSAELLLLRGADARSHGKAGLVYRSSLLDTWDFHGGDIDGDGHQDLVSVTIGTGVLLNTARIWFRDGEGRYHLSPNALTFPKAFQYAGHTFLRDLDGDGHADLILSPSDPGAGKPGVAFGSSDGFTSPIVPIDADQILGTVSLDAAGHPALVGLRGSDIQTIVVTSGRSFVSQTIYQCPAGGYAFVAETASPNIPAHLIVVPGNVVVTHEADGWRAGGQLPHIASRYLVADFNGDGLPDLAVGDSDLEIFLRASDGTYHLDSSYTTPQSIGAMSAVDFDGDGILDIVCTSQPADIGAVAVFRNRGGGRFDVYEIARTSEFRARTPVITDVDGDGFPDVVIPGYDGPEVLYNVCAGQQLFVAVSPSNPVAGASVTLVIHALKSDQMTIREGDTTFPTHLTLPAGDLGTFTWTSPPLQAGIHRFDIDSGGGSFPTAHTSVTVTVSEQPQRRHAARH